MPNRIVTVTLNPSIDVSSSTETITSEHKLRCTPVRRDPGGGGINVARVLTRLGADCRAVYAAGGVLGELLNRLLDAEAINCRAVNIASETRESFTIVEKTSGREYRFVLPGPRLEASEWQAVLDQVALLEPAPTYVVASGSLPEGVPEDFYGRLAHLCRARGTRIVVDASGPALAAALEAGVYLVKPNLRELRELTGEPLEDEHEWAPAASKIVISGKAEIVALSLGHRGALLASPTQRLQAPAIPVKVASTVGAGDSFLAGIVYGLASGAALSEAFRTAMAAGTAALLVTGTNLAHKRDIDELTPLVEVRSL